MSDESDQPKPDDPDATPAPVDEGLTQWMTLVQSGLQSQAGVEIMGKAGGSVHFRFRGQEFAVHIHRKA